MNRVKAQSMDVSTQTRKMTIWSKGLIALTKLCAVLVSAIGAGIIVIVIAAYMPWSDCIGCDFSEEQMPRAYFKNRNLAGIQMWSSDLRNSNFKNATLMGGNLSGSDFSGSNFEGANLSKATMFDADLRSANLRSANLVEASLWQANLEAAVLAGANLAGVALKNANLRRAELTGAEITGINLEGADLSYAIWIDGSVCAPNSIGRCLRIN